MKAPRLFVLVVAALIILPSGSASPYDYEAYRIIKHSNYLLRQVRDFPYGKSTDFNTMTKIFDKSGEQIPRGALPLSTKIVSDFVPWPRAKSALPDDRFPLYFPRKGQEYDRFGRRFPVFVPFFLSNDRLPEYFPFDRVSLRLAYPKFAVVFPYFLGDSTRFVQIPWRRDRHRGIIPRGFLFWGLPIVRREGEQPEYIHYFFP